MDKENQILKRQRQVRARMTCHGNELACKVAHKTNVLPDIQLIQPMAELAQTGRVVKKKWYEIWR